MARAETNLERNTFVRGLITEANPLTFPENASIDEDNFVLLRDGSRQRRLGLDFEEDFSLVDSGILSTSADSLATSIHTWDNINDNPNIGLVVVQIGNDLFFYDLFADPISAAPKNGGNALTLTAGDATKLIDTTVSLGRLLVVNGTKFINTLKYDEDTDTVFAEQRRIVIRDFFGVDDALDVTVRPGSLSQAHKYNLLNQGWDAAGISSFFSSQNVYPSNADIVFLGKDSEGDFKPNLLVKQFFGSSPAGKGKFVLDAFDRGTARAAAAGITSFGGQAFGNIIQRGFFGTQSGGISVNVNEIDGFDLVAFPSPETGIPEDRSTVGPKTVATYAGRVFYAGMGADIVRGDERSPQYNSYIFFSQSVISIDKITECMQEADPTSEHISDLIDTDGGTISIPEAGRILKLLPSGESLLVFADNGVWQIKGGDAIFSATSFDIVKISEVGVLSKDSIVAVEGIVLYWGKSGIYILSPDQVSGRLVAQNVSETTIQTFFNSISEVAGAKVRGAFDPVARQVRWMFNDKDTFDGVTRAYIYNRELIFDLTLQAFYLTTVQELSADTPFMSGYVDIPGVIDLTVEYDIVDGADDVVQGEDTIVFTVPGFARQTRGLKYYTTQHVTGGNLKYTFSAFSDSSFVDWKSSDNVGLDAPAFLLTGFEIFQDTQRIKQVTYLTTHFNLTETGFTKDVNDNLIFTNPSSCKIQAQWEWTDNAASGRFGKEFQAYRLKRLFLPQSETDPFEYGFQVVTTKSKLRGKGRSLSLKISTEPLKDLQILGWALNTTGATKV